MTPLSQLKRAWCRYCQTVRLCEWRFRWGWICSKCAEGK